MIPHIAVTKGSNRLAVYQLVADEHNPLIILEYAIRPFFKALGRHLALAKIAKTACEAELFFFGNFLTAEDKNDIFVP